MTVTHRLTSARYDIYKDLVTKTARDELDDDEELENEQEYPFDTNYQLFAAGLAIGFLRGEKREESEGNYVPSFIAVNRIGGGGDNEYRQSIKFMYELVKQEHPELDEDEVWEETKQYADAGIEFIYQDVENKDKFDMLGFVEIAESEWKDRLGVVIDYPQEDG